MTLPAPHYTTTGLDEWKQAVPALLPLPPGEPESWTCLLKLLGPGVLFVQDDRGTTEGMDKDLMRLILAELGRPVRSDEREGLLLATPVPGTASFVAIIPRLLRNSSYWVRQRTALCLGHMGDTTHVPALLANLYDDDNDARRGAVEALGRLGDPSVAPALIKKLGDGDTSVDGAVVEALIRLDVWEEVAEAIEALEADAAPANPLLKAIVAAEEKGESDEIGEMLSTGEDWTKRSVSRYLASRPKFAAAQAEALVAHLQTEDDLDVAMVGAVAAGRAGEEALESLIELLDHTNWKTRMLGAMALCWVDDLGPAAPKLVEKLDDDDSDVQREAALAALVHGQARGRAAGKIRQHFSGSYQFIRRASEVAATGVPELSMIAMLTGHAPPGRDLIGLLTGSYGDDRARGVGAMLLTLAEPELMAPVMEALALDAAQSHSVDFRRYCAGALLLTGTAPARMGSLHRILLCHEGSVSSMPKGAVGSLRGRAGELAALAATDSDWQVRLDAMKLLQLLGNEVEPFRELLAHVAQSDSDSDCRNQAGDMLERPWATAGLADQLAALIAPNRHQDSDSRAASFRQLAARDHSLGSALAIQFMSGNDRGLARAGATVLGAGATAETAPTVVSLGVGRLDDSSWIAREAACDLLGAIPPEALGDLIEEVAEALNVKAEEDDDSDVQSAARMALGRLGVETGDGT